MEDFELIEKAYELLSRVNNPATRLWRIAWSFGHRQQMSIYDIQETQKLIDQYSYDWVREAFQASADQQIFTLSYVKGILKKHKQEESLKKAKEFALSKAKEISIITGEPIREKTDMTAWKGFAKKTLGND